MSFERLVRFVPRSDESTVLIGQPVDPTVDVGKAVFNGEDVKVNVFSGSSVLNPRSQTGREESISRILSPLKVEEVGTIRCIGLNYYDHAKEANMATPDVPTVFMKPATSLADPYPALTPIPKHTVVTDSADYESELAVVIGKTCKNVSEADAMDYVLGYTACNDISSRAAQFATTQWSYSKGFDKACPIGPVLVSTSVIKDPTELHMKGWHSAHEKPVQDQPLKSMIFTIAQLVSFLSQGTTLPAGTLIITGTPAGVGAMRKPPLRLRDKDQFIVEILPHIGSLYSVMEEEK